MESNAQTILARRMAEVEERKAGKKAAIAELFQAYPDIKAWAKDLKDAGFDVKIEGFQWAIHGPMRQAPDYAATAGSHLAPPRSRRQSESKLSAGTRRKR